MGRALLLGRLDGKVALITGGARGQGRSHALTFAREGAEVAVCDLAPEGSADALRSVPYPLASAEDLEETRRAVEALGRGCLAVRADVRSSAQMRGAAEQTVERFGKVDVLVANAGIESFGTAHELTEEQWDEMLAVNLTGVWKSCRAVIPHMIERGRGAILITSSIAGLKGLANQAHYCAAKHGVVGLMRSLAIELAPHGIRVNTVHPSSVDTPIIKNQAMYTLFSGGRLDATLDEVTSAFRDLNLLDTPWMEPEDISHAMVYLASDEARYVTGTTFTIDAGLMAK
ncbi:oxidoreductase, SDR family [Rubrobacter radiotolerans]|uniref:Mycofactocin-coupled SDR family oxidoreductase n=1 Tax=Rubrobacter radiotolerans TaxID=42256 RepID=A0A023X618_RUBRA|nr:mycofactocin-coupled SDR family oxidoreductase [Rubrobacter radiotolerans]AHY47917.1 oxidoreductase, SDR family [Rubrobacter radiotolerans]MDX5892556.1 mycofactocin-coupled SDR family oxidoreductase [Rubrobacter radiotolerans]SMC07845.1 SDR family mycofactocin-dependent oxidoreductase [Rubrobacter radiotolerans DSM 5868]